MAAVSSGLDPDMIRDVLECPICLEAYNQEKLRPKLLKCGHTVCLECLEKLLANTINGVRCPFCNKVSHMSSISQLSDNLTALKILDFTKSCGAAATLMCKSCCSRLPRQYCFDCTTILCELCKVEDHQHQGHSVQSIWVAAEQRRKELCDRLTALRRANDGIQKKKITIEDINKSLSLRYQAVQQDYDKAELCLHQQLEMSRRIFTASIAEVERLNREVLEEQTYLLSIAEVKVMSRCDYLTMLMRQSDIALLKEDGKDLDDNDLDLRRSLPSMLKLQEPELVRTEHSKTVEVGQVTKKIYTVSTDDASKVALERDVDCIDGAIRTVVGATSAPLDLYRHIDTDGDEEGCGSLSSFKSTGAGGGSAGASAAPLVCQFVKQIGCKGIQHSMFNLPVSICVTARDEFMVADRGNNRIQIFNQSGFQGEIRRGARSINNLVLSVLGADLPNLIPLSVAVTPQGLIGVTDNYDNSVKVYTMDGQCVACHKKQLVKPWGITATPSGQFVVTDVEGGKLWCLAVDRNLGVVSYNRLCSARRPKFVTCDAAGTVYFTQGLAMNIENHPNESNLEGGFSISSVDADGNLGKQLSHFFSETEDFRCITGMCVDASGDLLVTDSVRKEILLFPKDGGFKILIHQGLTWPVGVATTQKGQLLVMDMLDHCIKVYTYTPRSLFTTS